MGTGGNACNLGGFGYLYSQVGWWLSYLDELQSHMMGF
jgi:hypothetical protein